ncbi:TPA: chromosomal replication initiator protein DnaA [Patescibacteria group bacterium]|uniref:Chromosomal replication initiator protein DnaA n=1 Tax=candidate division Kazan bacterium GW2011_GWA1_44_22 TaxID=1620410 RepID=A0A0G1KZF5_UNCK3|nr:MAG: Chromosomal replication initiator protein DnaA [candidate division Kazan bacterium GW2011_GWA1_44_22]HCR42097.1 chromosomal replication initiator protein DnaA [Patescibacteria group bacterium]
MVDNKRLWQSVLGEAEIALSPANFSTWFKNTEIINASETVVFIRVPNIFTKEWFEKKYEKEIITKCLLRNLPHLGKIEYVIGVKPQRETIFNEPTTLKSTERLLERPPIATLIKTRGTGETIERLNPRYTFETFVIGESNHLAQAASEAVAKAPGTTYNPLFIYGGVGLGKTHLLQAIGNAILTNYPKKKVVYITSERFTNELVDSILKKTTREFKEKYRRVDCLLIDDVQFLEGKDATQEEFFHTFNALYESSKQIVLTSDRPPKAIAALEARLRSRFEWGMMADITAPNYETRLAILRSKSANLKFPLADNILELIAQKIQNNIRELEGALTRTVAFGQLNNTVPTIEEAEGLLGGILISPGKKILRAHDIIRTVSKYYDLKKEDLLGKQRNKEIVVPRQILIYLLREELDLPYTAIAREIGGKDHTTIIHNYNKIKNLVLENTDLENEILSIKEKLYSVDTNGKS